MNWKLIAVVSTIALAAAVMAIFINNSPEPSGCPLTAPAHSPGPTPKDFPGVGSYYIGQDARCNQYGKCVAENVRNSCAPTREGRSEKMTFVFDALSCGGYDSDHTELVVYPDGTCEFVGVCPSECPGR